MKSPTPDGRLKIVLGEYDTGWHDTAASLREIEKLAASASRDGADLLVLPEMCTTGFTMDVASHAVDRDDPSIAELCRISRDSRIHLIAGVATRAPWSAGGSPAREGESSRVRFYNSSFFITPDGVIAAEYRKQRLFAYAKEDTIYSAGDHFEIISLNGMKLAMFICFDLRFPELFREVAPLVDAIVIIANWPTARQSHWETLIRARAIESQSYVIAVNRLGSADRLEYRGGSAVIDPWGETIGSAGTITEIIRALVSEARRKFPFVTDLRDRSAS